MSFFSFEIWALFNSFSISLVFKCTKLPSSSFLTLPNKWKFCVHLGIFLLKSNMPQFGEDRRSRSCLSQSGSLQVLLWRRRESAVYLTLPEQGIRSAVTSPLGIEMGISYGSPVKTRECKARCALFSKLTCLIRMSEVCVCIGGMLWRNVFSLFDSFLKIELNIFVSLQIYKWNIKKCAGISIRQLAMDWLFCPQYSYVEATGFKVILFGDGAFGKQLGLDKVMRVEPHEGISALIRKGRDESLSVFSKWEHNRKMTICKPGTGPSPNTEWASILILDCLAS